MPIRLALCNQKGGCGKTTSSVNIAACLAKLGFKTLLIDMDYQGNASGDLGVGKQALTGDKHISKGLLEGVPLEDLILNTAYKNLDVVAADMELERLNWEKMMEPGATHLLTNWLDCDAGKSYDYIIIDSHPSLDLLFQNALTACDHYIVPLFAEPNSYSGLHTLFSQIAKIQKNLNTSLKFLGVVITNYNAKSSTHKKYMPQIEKFVEDNQMKILGSIPNSTAVASSSEEQKPLIQYKPSLPISKAYLRLTKAIIEQQEKQKEEESIIPEISKEDIKNLIQVEMDPMEEVSFD